MYYLPLSLRGEGDRGGEVDPYVLAWVRSS